MKSYVCFVQIPHAAAKVEATIVKQGNRALSQDEEIVSQLKCRFAALSDHLTNRKTCVNTFWPL